MNVLVDTSVWSLALRRSRPRDDPTVAELTELIREYRVQMLGAIRQELLSGIRTSKQFERLRQHLRAYPDLAIPTDIYELAADFFNQCRRQGVQGSNTDFLICASAHHYDLSIFTTDQDFRRYQELVPIRLHELRAG